MTEQLKQPYVGVSGVVSPEMQANLEVIIDSTDLTKNGRLLALGIKAVHKTQYLDIENKYGNEWYPVGEEAFRHALRPETPRSDTIAVAQTYLDIENVGDADYRNEFVHRIISRGEPWLQAIQFDMLPWHNNPDMWSFLESVKGQGVEVFLQAHKPAMELLGPQRLMRLLARHAELVDYVLFDSSHGTGTRLDTKSLDPFIAEAYASLDTTTTGIAIAGGLSGDVVREELPALISNYPRLSWDAEGQLHPINRDNKRPLDMTITQDYLIASSDILHRITPLD
jgi:hypothetical protein